MTCGAPSPSWKTITKYGPVWPSFCNVAQVRLASNTRAGRVETEVSISVRGQQVLKLIMNFKTAFLGAATLLAAGSALCQPLPNNFWPNSTFDSGTDLGAANGAGTPTGWVRNGSLSGSLNVIDQVTNVDLPNSTNAIMVNDNDPNNYGEWDCAVPVAGVVNPGDTINVRYDLMWNVQGGQMRVALGFLDASSNYISADQFVVEGASPGWNGGIDSTFTETNQMGVVPIGTVFVNIGVVSGGSCRYGCVGGGRLVCGARPDAGLLVGNVWPNPSFELGTNLDQTNGVPTGWNFYNSGSSYITQVTTNNYVSSDHALVVVDNDPDNYGSWYSDMVSLTGIASPGATLDLQWFQLYSVTNGQMRVTFSFYNSREMTWTTFPTKSPATAPAGRGPWRVQASPRSTSKSSRSRPKRRNCWFNWFPAAVRLPPAS
jgi:hypothetical protein